MTFLRNLNFDRPAAARLWPALDPETRSLAAQALYDGGDPAQRSEADAAIAERMNFRMVSVRKLPMAKRVEYLARAVLPDESLATDLLLALHLEGRRDMLAAFLDALEIPNDRGTIDEDHDMRPPEPDALRGAVQTLFESFPEKDVELYLACLWAMDNGNWGGLTDILRERAAG
jgi:hypothetical protein